MRELLIKNLHSKDKKRTELFLNEHYEKEGVIQEIEKKTVYRIKSILEFTNASDLDIFLEQKKRENVPPSRFLIRSRDKQTATTRFLYKIVGEQFVLLKDKIVVMKVSQYVKKTVIRKNETEKISTPNS